MATKLVKDASSLGEMFALRCAQSGEKVAYWVPGKPGHSPVTYAEHWQKVLRWAGALRELGLNKGDTINLFSENCYEWALADWACQLLGITAVPIYPTLPADQAAYIIQDCSAKMVFCGHDDLLKKAGNAPKMLLRGTVDSLAAKAESASPIREWPEVQRSDLATIIYTSGTTGNPKGARLSHDNFLFMMEAIQTNVPLRESDVFLSMLPLSHVYERVNGHVLPIYLGATIAYTGSLASVASDFLQIKPTVMLCVPRFLDALRGRILDGVTKAPKVRQKLFHAALAQGTAQFKGKPAPLAGVLDKLVAVRIRDRVGGRLRFFVSGGAALPAHIAEFYGAFGITILQGFGMTETTSGICVNLPEDNDYKSIGKPIGGVEMKLAEDGEILIRGRCNMLGYHNLPEETAKTIDPEGWLHTGDIGELRGERYYITDRKKDLLILANGKNVAPQPIENILKESAYIAEAVLFGDGMEYVCGLIIPDLEKVKAFAAEQGIRTEHPEELLKADPVRQLLKKEIDAANKRLADFEKVKRYTLIHAQFSVETGELTPSMKVRRRVVKEKFATEIASLMRN